MRPSTLSSTALAKTPLSFGDIWRGLARGIERPQKIPARLCALKAEDEPLLEALARMMDCWSPLEKPWCFLAIEALLPPSTFWRAFHQHWRSFQQPPLGRYLWSLGRRRLH